MEIPGHHYHRAPVMELADMRDLGSRAAMRVGSSPPSFRKGQFRPNLHFFHVILK